MSIRAEDVYRLAKLAKLRIAEDAVEGVERDLSKILQMVDQLREVDTSFKKIIFTLFKPCIFFVWLFSINLKNKTK